MLLRMAYIALVGMFMFGVAGCAEDDVKTSTETQSRTESAPQDTSPGEFIVE